ncbi:hypothetical protein [Massilia psychrophila]|uniref:hypothetical protein n=1 Tax=Massilia psychrophila TaxID=1603353 RepID=UPI00117C674F|nr:hypothetical protein [Massilia psychrophila]
MTALDAWSNQLAHAGLKNRSLCIITRFSDFPSSGLLAQKRVINFAGVVDAMAAADRDGRAFACLFRVFLFTQKVCIQV